MPDLELPREFAFKETRKNHFEIELHGQKAGYVEIRPNASALIKALDGELEYEILPKFQGQGLARKTCEALRETLRARGIEKLWITCDPENTASRRTLENLGATNLGLVKMPKTLPRLRFLWKV